MKGLSQDVSLRISSDLQFLPVALSFVEGSAKAFGLEKTDALKLTLACEETFTYICSVSKEVKPLVIKAAKGIFYVQISFFFNAADFNPRAFNLTTQISVDDEQCLEEMGLLIASRSVERFRIFHGRDGISLVLIKEKTYPPAQEMKLPDIKPMETFTVRVPDPGTLKLFAGQVTRYYPEYLYPGDFLFPGKLMDMVAGGDYSAAVAVDKEGLTGGGVVWMKTGEKMVEFFGPYLFSQSPQSLMAERLISAAIENLAKSDNLFLITRYATPELPPGYFEPLGTIDIFKEGSPPARITVYFRQLKEDPGSSVWAHPALEEFLTREYRRLYFARHIKLTEDAGESRPDNSVFGARFMKTQSLVHLEAVWDGKDSSDNLARHLKTLEGEGIQNIFFEIDLAFAWQATLVPALLDQGFTPRLVIPYAGEGDIVLFQHGKGR